MAWFRDETRHINADVRIDCKLKRPNTLILNGRIVTMDGSSTVIEDGVLVIDGKRIVHCAPSDQPLPERFKDQSAVRTGGTIYPGLFELHNHPAYNSIPLWVVPRHFDRRDQWRRSDEYGRFVKKPATLLTHDPTSQNARAVVRFVECRALLGGVTTTQGLSLNGMNANETAAYAGLVRNVELPDDMTWPAALDHIGDFTSHAGAQQKYGPIIGDRSKPFLLHLSEGIDEESRVFFESLRKPDGSYLIGSNLVGIHATALNPTQMARMRNSAGIVWSPLSNLLLYGDTTDVIQAKTAGVPIALGSDWGPSGTKNLLGELKMARIVSAHLGGVFSDRELAAMVTTTPAGMVGWNDFLGSLEVGKIADCVVLDGVTDDPYTQLINATESDILTVVIDGRPRAGRATIIDPGTAGVEMLRVAKQDLVVDVVDRGHPLEGMALSTAIVTLSHALAHLPDLADQFQTQHRLIDGGAGRFFVDLDMDEAYARAVMAGKISIGRDEVEPMELDPITEVDDLRFRARLKQNINIPEWLREAL